MERSPCPHLELLNTFQPVQIWHQSDPVFQRPQELHLELHHLPKVPEQNVQLQHNEPFLVQTHLRHLLKELIQPSKSQPFRP